MAIRWYILPATTEDVVLTRTSTGENYVADTVRRPKYLGSSPVAWGGMPYGLEPVFLCWADVTPAQHSQLAAQSDVQPIPEDIDQTISPGALNTVRDNLEALHIPAGWVTTADTYREVMRVVCGVFQLSQRYNGMHRRRLVEAGVTLNTQWTDLPAGFRQRLRAAAESHNYDTSELSGTSTLRDILKFLSDQWQGTTFYINGREL